MMRAIAYVFGLGSAALIVGCGIGGTDSLFVSGGVGGGAQSAAGGQGGTGNPTAGGQGGAPSTSSSVSSVVSSSAMSSSAMSSSAMSSSSTGMPDRKVDCGNSQCSVTGNKACCWKEPLRDPGSGSCISGLDGCDTSTQGLSARITCEKPDQCPGQVCCGHLAFIAGGGDYYTSVDCADACAGTGEVTLCDPNDNSDSCNGGDCAASQLLPPGYFVCGN